MARMIGIDLGTTNSVMATIEATRDFWIADANLETALTTGTPGATSAMPAIAPAAPAAARSH